MNAEILLFTTIIELIVIVFLDLIIFKQYSMLKGASVKIANLKNDVDFWNDSSEYWRRVYFDKLRDSSKKPNDFIIKTSKSKGVAQNE